MKLAPVPWDVERASGALGYRVRAHTSHNHATLRQIHLGSSRATSRKARRTPHQPNSKPAWAVAYSSCGSGRVRFWAGPVHLRLRTPPRPHLRSRWRICAGCRQGGRGQAGPARRARTGVRVWWVVRMRRASRGERAGQFGGSAPCASSNVCPLPLDGPPGRLCTGWPRREVCVHALAYAKSHLHRVTRPLQVGVQRRSWEGAGLDGLAGRSAYSPSPAPPT